MPVGVAHAIGRPGLQAVSGTSWQAFSLNLQAGYLSAAMARQQAMNNDNGKKTPDVENIRDGVQRAARAERLKQSLRANLQRRKAKSRAIRAQRKGDPS
jgi:hypothetical protein